MRLQYVFIICLCARARESEVGESVFCVLNTSKDEIFLFLSSPNSPLHFITCIAKVTRRDDVERDAFLFFFSRANPLPNRFDLHPCVLLLRPSDDWDFRNSFAAASFHPIQQRKNRTRRPNKSAILRRHRHARAQTSHEKEFPVPVTNGIGKSLQPAFVVDEKTGKFALECGTDLGTNTRGPSKLYQRERYFYPSANLSDEFWLPSKPNIDILRDIKRNWTMSHECDRSDEHPVGRNREDEFQQ